VENHRSHLCLACQREVLRPLRLWLSKRPAGYALDAAFCGLKCLQAWLERQLKLNQRGALHV